MHPRLPDLHAALPREHGLWSWLLAPLCLAVAIAPAASRGPSLLAALAVLLGFLAGNAARAGAVGLAAPLGAAATALGLALVPWLAVPGPWAALLVGAPLLALGALAAPAGSAPGRLFAALQGPHGTRPGAQDPTGVELAVIAGFGVLGALLSVAAGVPLASVVAPMAGLVAFEVVGLWWVRGQLARVLPGRRPWRGGHVVAAFVVAAGLAAGLSQQPWLVAVPALYGARALLTPTPRSARDARRLGLGEAAWTLVAVGLTVALLVALAPGGSAA